MKIAFQTRALYPGELRSLKRIITQTEKSKTYISKSMICPLALLLGIVCACLAVGTAKESFWYFIFGTVAVLGFSTFVFGTIEELKAQGKNKDILRLVNERIEKGTVDTCLINATRMACAQEFEDEGDWYIFELGNDTVLRFWDVDYAYNNKKFPCLHFEIYEENYVKLIHKDIYPLSEKVKPVKMINPKKKWKYMCEKDPFERLAGACECMNIANIGFDELINQIEAL